MSDIRREREIILAAFAAAGAQDPSEQDIIALRSHIEYVRSSFNAYSYSSKPDWLKFKAVSTRTKRKSSSLLADLEELQLLAPKAGRFIRSLEPLLDLMREFDRELDGVVHDGVDYTNPESIKLAEALTRRRVRTWLAEAAIPRIYRETFNKSPGFSSLVGSDELGGPYVRFVRAILPLLGLTPEDARFLSGRALKQRRHRRSKVSKPDD